MKTFERSGVRFSYPANWVLEADDADGGWTATVQSQDTAFLLVSLRPDADGPGPLADEALAALRAEYGGLEADPVIDQLAGQPAAGYDVDFLTVDTAVMCRIRCLDTAAGPLLLLAQASAYDLARNDLVLRAMAASLAVED